MAKIISLSQVKDSYVQTFSGKVRCLSCKHEWTGVVNDIQAWLKCPECHKNSGRLINHVEKSGEMHWTCSCGNDLFYIQPDKIYCPNCGETQDGF